MYMFAKNILEGKGET